MSRKKTVTFLCAPIPPGSLPRAKMSLHLGLSQEELTRFRGHFIPQKSRTGRGGGRGSVAGASPDRCSTSGCAGMRPPSHLHDLSQPEGPGLRLGQPGVFGLRPNQPWVADIELHPHKGESFRTGGWSWTPGTPGDGRGNGDASAQLVLDAWCWMPWTWLCTGVVPVRQFTTPIRGSQQPISQHGT